MQIRAAAGYTALSILSLGVSQAFSAVGLAITALKTIYDLAMRAFHEQRLRSTPTDSPSRTLRERKIHYYNHQLDLRKTYAKTYAVAMIPLLGMPLAYKKGYLADYAFTCTRQNLSGPRGQSLVQNFVYPLRNEIDLYKKINEGIFDQLFHSYEQLDLQTKDGRKIDAVWIAGTGFGAQNKKTVILFHGNGTTLYGNGDTARWFHNQGLNVLLITLGGYPGRNDQPGITSELTTYHDAQAAVDYVKTRLAVDNGSILAYGMSIGGSLAFQVGAHNPGVHVFTNQTFTKVVEVPDNAYPALRSIGKGALTAGCPTGISDGTFTTDGLDNRRKASLLQGSYFGIYAARDHMMGKKQENFTHALVDAYRSTHPDVKKEEIILEIPGDHCASFTVHNHAVHAVRVHLDKLQFTSPRPILKGMPQNATVKK